MSKPKYIGRDGSPLTRVDWQAKRADPTYCTVRQYDNGVVQVTLKWSGVITQATLEEYWPVYILLVKNYLSDGSTVNDPVDGDKTFPNELTGLAAYEEFLTRWTDCTTTQDDEGNVVFVEADNALTPEPPPNPDRPTTVWESGVGAW